MKPNEEIQNILLTNLSDLNLDTRYYGLVEELSMMKMTGSDSEPFSIENYILDVFGAAQYFKKEDFYRCVYPFGEDEIFFHITANNLQVEFGLYIMSGQQYIAGGTMHGLAYKVAQQRTPTFTYNPRYPRLPCKSREMLNKILLFGHDLLQEIHQLSSTENRYKT